MKRVHPILLANAVLAHPAFIIALNVGFAVVLRLKLFGIDATDFGMSWVTMFMDQVIIAAGWIGYTRTLKWQRKIDKELRAIQRAIESEHD